MSELPPHNPDAPRKPGADSPYLGSADQPAPHAAKDALPEDHPTTSLRADDETYGKHDATATELNEATDGESSALAAGHGQSDTDGPEAGTGQPGDRSGAEHLAKSVHDVEPLDLQRQQQLMRELYGYLEEQEEQGELARVREQVDAGPPSQESQQTSEEPADEEQRLQDGVPHSNGEPDKPFVWPEGSVLGNDMPHSERDLVAAPQEIHSVVADVGELISRQPLDSDESEVAGEAIANAVELLGKANSLPEAEDVGDYKDLGDLLNQVAASDSEEAQPATQVAGLREMLESMPTVQPRDLAQAYFVEGERFRNMDSLEKLNSMLIEERTMLAAESADPEEGAQGYPELLETVVEACEQLGLDPEHWIEKYAAGREDAWQLWVDHCVRLDEAGKDVELYLLTKAAELLPPDGAKRSFSAQFICDNTPLALAICDDPVIRSHLIERFQQAKREVAINPDVFDKLLTVGMEALEDAKSATLAQLDELIRASAREIQEQNEQEIDDPNDLAEMNGEVVEGQTKWGEVLKVRFGVPPQMVADDIKKIEDSGKLIDRDVILEAAAVQYARQDEFASAHHLIKQMTPRRQEAAYVDCWGLAEKPSQLRQLDPNDSEWVSQFNPEFREQFLAAQALVSGNPAEMAKAAVSIAASLLAVGGVQNPDASAPVNANLRWHQLEQTLDRVEQTGGPEAAQALSRELLTVLRAPDLPFNHLLPLHKRLAVTGRQSDYELVRETILGRLESPAQKALHLTRFALQLP